MTLLGSGKGNIGVLLPFPLLSGFAETKKAFVHSCGISERM